MATSTIDHQNANDVGLSMFMDRVAAHLSNGAVNWTVEHDRNGNVYLVGANVEPDTPPLRFHCCRASMFQTNAPKGKVQVRQTFERPKDSISTYIDPTAHAEEAPRANVNIAKRTPESVAGDLWRRLIQKDRDVESGGSRAAALARKAQQIIDCEREQIEKANRARIVIENNPAVKSAHPESGCISLQPGTLPTGYINARLDGYGGVHLTHGTITASQFNAITQVPALIALLDLIPSMTTDSNARDDAARLLSMLRD